MDGWVKGVAARTKETRPTRPLSEPLKSQASRSFPPLRSKTFLMNANPATFFSRTRSSHWQVWSTASRPNRESNPEPHPWSLHLSGFELETIMSSDFQNPRDFFSREIATAGFIKPSSSVLLNDRSVNFKGFFGWLLYSCMCSRLTSTESVLIWESDYTRATLILSDLHKRDLCLRATKHESDFNTLKQY